MSHIKIMKAFCGSFPSGFCYSACNPYYSGHYPTKEKAALAAVKTKQKLARQSATTDASTKGDGK